MYKDCYYHMYHVDNKFKNIFGDRALDIVTGMNNLDRYTRGMNIDISKIFEFVSKSSYMWDIIGIFDRFPDGIIIFSTWFEKILRIQILNIVTTRYPRIDRRYDYYRKPDLHAIDTYYQISISDKRYYLDTLGKLRDILTPYVNTIDILNLSKFAKIKSEKIEDPDVTHGYYNLDYKNIFIRHENRYGVLLKNNITYLNSCDTIFGNNVDNWSERLDPEGIDRNKYLINIENNLKRLVMDCEYANQYYIPRFDF